jgi:hypothetical protein
VGLAVGLADFDEVPHDTSSARPSALTAASDR